MDRREEAAESLNQMLVELFQEILGVEEMAVKKATNKQLTMTEIHTLVAIGSEDERMSEVAQRLGVTISTLTTAIKKLESKGYVLREKDAGDRRVVHVTLTEKGKTTCEAHEGFHRRMIRAAVKELSEEEVSVLSSSVEQLKAFFYMEMERYMGE